MLEDKEYNKSSVEFKTKSCRHKCSQLGCMFSILNLKCEEYSLNESYGRQGHSVIIQLFLKI